METEFLPWLQAWEDQVKSMKDMTVREKNQLLLSQETLQGIRITSNKHCIYM